MSNECQIRWFVLYNFQLNSKKHSRPGVCLRVRLKFVRSFWIYSLYMMIMRIIVMIMIFKYLLMKVETFSSVSFTAV